MNIETIALDLDGTLLGESGSVSDRNRRSLERAAASGIRIILCTGRHHFDAQWIAERLGTVSFVISSNGAHLTDRAGAVRGLRCFGSDEIDAVGEAIREAGVYGIYYLEDGIVIDSSSPVLPWYEKRNRELSGRLELCSTRDPLAEVVRRATGVLKVAVNSYEGGALERLDGAYSRRGIASTSSSPYNREVMAADTSKAVAVEEALELVGSSFATLLAVGDGRNDIEIIRAAAVGVAMENGCDELKIVADSVCPSNTADGVAVTVEELLREREQVSCARVAVPGIV